MTDYDDFKPLKRRQPSQVRECWPFLYSVDPERGLVKNVPPRDETAEAAPVKVKKRSRGWAGRRAAWNNKKKIP